MPLSQALKALVHAPRYAARASKYQPGVTIPAGVSGSPKAAPQVSILQDLFHRMERDAESHGIRWGEWLTLSTATLFAINAPSTLRVLHTYVMHHGGTLRPLADRVDRACLMREVGLKTLGLIGTPRAINNLAALRASVDADADLAAHMPTESRRALSPEQLQQSFRAGSDLFDDIYAKQSQKLRGVLAHHHPDLGEYIVHYEYGPLFAPASQFHRAPEPSWEVNRVRMSLLAVAALHAQGGVAPQVVSHVYGLLRARPHIQADAGLVFLTSEAGAMWAIETINDICRVVDGAEDAERQVAHL